MHQILSSYSKMPISILNEDIPLEAYTPLNLSPSNLELKNIDIVDYAVCQNFINGVLIKNEALIAYGGYLEKRTLYADKPDFASDGDMRNIHLGMDFWTGSGTSVLTPMDGKVHSFKNNSKHGDYGPTIILEHNIGDLIFYTLFGHLSKESLDELYIGKKFKKGETLASLGTPEINVGYSPHLHFQIIRDIGDYIGDYPGVCSEKDLEYYTKNCPDPNLLLKIK